MKIIGITGPIGSGKSTVTGILSAEFGAKIINADEVSRLVVEKGQPAYNEIIACFGTDILDESGRLNRKKLSNIVFQDSEKLELLNGITHKYIVDKIAEEINKVRVAKAAELIGLECIIPVEHGFMDVVDEVWIVTADMDIRIKRIMVRSGLSHKEAIDRINSQKSEEEYLKIANRVIYNNGSLPLLKEKIKALVNKNIG